MAEAQARSGFSTPFSPEHFEREPLGMFSLVSKGKNINATTATQPAFVSPHFLPFIDCTLTSKLKHDPKSGRKEGRKEGTPSTEQVSSESLHFLGNVRPMFSRFPQKSQFLRGQRVKFYIPKVT